jgi:hypothetical protein
VQHSIRINSAAYFNFSCPYHSPVRVQHIVSRSRIIHQ